MEDSQFPLNTNPNLETNPNLNPNQNPSSNVGFKPNDLYPSWALIQDGLEIVYELEYLETQQERLIEIKDKFKQQVQYFEEDAHPAALIHALRQLTDVFENLIEVQLRISTAKDKFLGCLVLILKERCLLVCDNRMMKLVVKFYNMGWRGIIGIPWNIDAQVIHDIRDSILSLPGLSSIILNFSVFSGQSS